MEALRPGKTAAMNHDSHEQLMETTRRARERAEALLRSLETATSATTGAAGGETDAYKAVTGRSAIENAIASTKRMIEALDRASERVESFTTASASTEVVAGGSWGQR